MRRAFSSFSLFYVLFRLWSSSVFLNCCLDSEKMVIPFYVGHGGNSHVFFRDDLRERRGGWKLWRILCSWIGMDGFVGDSSFIAKSFGRHRRCCGWDEKLALFRPVKTATRLVKSRYPGSIRELFARARDISRDPGVLWWPSSSFRSLRRASSNLLLAGVRRSTMSSLSSILPVVSVCSQT